MRTPRQTSVTGRVETGVGKRIAGCDGLPGADTL